MRLENIKSIHHNHRAISGTFNGQAVWVKYAVVPARPFSSTLFNLLSSVTRSQIFRSTHNPNGIDALRTEARRLREMKDKGYLVPDIIAKGNTHMILSDIGTSLDKAATEEPDINTRRRILCRAATHLAGLHAKGDFHGRSRAKDMTIRGNEIGMIDLEHEPLKVMSLPEAQARDFWYLLYDIAKFQTEDRRLIPDMIGDYKLCAPSESLQALRHAVDLLQPFSSALRGMTKMIAPGNHACKIADMNDSLSRHLKI